MLIVSHNKRLFILMKMTKQVIVLANKSLAIGCHRLSEIIYQKLKSQNNKLR